MTVLTPANQLTLLRLILAPVFALFMLYGRPGWALHTFMVAGITDLFDGYLARATARRPSAPGSTDGRQALLATMFVMLTIPGLGLRPGFLCG